MDRSSRLPEPLYGHIRIEGLRVPCRIGTSTEERNLPQDVLIDIDLEVDISTAVRSDRLSDTVDYREVRDRVIAAVRDREFNLVEALAYHVARICRTMPHVRSVHIAAFKPGALTGVSKCAIELTL